MSPKQWKPFFPKACEIDYDYLQIHGFAKKGEGRYTIRKCNKTTYIECTPGMKPF